MLWCMVMMRKVEISDRDSSSTEFLLVINYFLIPYFSVVIKTDN